MALVEHNIMSRIDSGSIDSTCPECSHNHLCVLVASEGSRRADDGPVHVSFIVKDSAASTASANKIDFPNSRRLCWQMISWPSRIEKWQIDLAPWVLIPADDDARPIDVQKEHSRLWR